jgi:gamma-glutamyltranspeptidase/glutathione hydrolase
MFDEKGSVKAVLARPAAATSFSVVKTLIALIDWGMDAQAAADLLNFGSQGHGLRSSLAIPPSLAA